MKINETKKRSLLKAVSYRILEILAEALVLSCFLEVAVAFGVAVAMETLCLVLHYIFERIWNRINYGREISG